MSGPLPKDPSVRQRRNKTSTRATLTKPDTATVPDLPEMADPETGDALVWLPLTQRWWRELWASPMAPEFDASDIHGLYILAALVNGFWLRPSRELAAEIRLQRGCFGLSPMDRRRLQWEIERVDEAQDKGRRRRQAARTPAETGEDPRDVLRAVT